MKQLHSHWHIVGAFFSCCFITISSYRNVVAPTARTKGRRVDVHMTATARVIWTDKKHLKHHFARPTPPTSILTKKKEEKLQKKRVLIHVDFLDDDEKKWHGKTRGESRRTKREGRGLFSSYKESLFLDEKHLFGGHRNDIRHPISSFETLIRDPRSGMERRSKYNSQSPYR